MEKFINGLLAKFGGKTKDLVYLSVTPEIGLEIIQIDPTIKSVKAYSYRPLAYSESKREIENYDQFASSLEDLLKELNISRKCNIVINLPSVYLGKMELALLLNDESVTEALTSDAEQSYIFKRCEPVISWIDATTNSGSETRNVLYGAVQKTAIDKIKSILSEMGATLSGIEISPISTLRAMDYAGLAEAQMNENVPWNLMLVNQTGYTILAMLGKKIVDFYEEPMPLKTYEAEELYDAIASSAQLALMGLSANYLYIVSQTDMVNAELLGTRIQADCAIETFDSNSFRKKDILPVSLNVLQENVSKISMQVIGIGLTRISPYPIKLEFTGVKEVETVVEEASISFEIDGKEVTLSETILNVISIAVTAVIVLPLLLLAFLILPNIEKKDKATLDNINNEIKTVEGEIKKLSEEASHTGFVVKTEIENVLKKNRSKLMAYSALGSSVPKGLWLTYFTTKDSGKIDVKGVGESVEDIYLFFRNIKDSLIDQKLKLHKLEMLSNSVDTAIETGSTNYEFEITNMSNEELSGTSTTTQQANTQQQNQQNQQSQQGQQEKAPVKKFTEVLPQVNMKTNN